jgi:hypothetical protein
MLELAMKNTIIKLTLGGVLALGSVASFYHPPILADGSIPIPQSLISRFDEAMAKVADGNNRIAVIRQEVSPSMDAIRAISEATLYQAGVKTEDITKYELDPVSKSLRLKK